MCDTINWSTFAEILAAGTPLTAGIREPIDPAVIGRLEATFPDVRRALTLDGLSLEEYEDFGPVQHFRNSFVAGWSAVRAAIVETRAALAEVAR
jgi:transaldolase